MSVFAPPRPPAREHPRTGVERRRAQEALIKEARRRARQRRQRFVALALLGLITATAVGPAASSGGHATSIPNASDPLSPTTGAAHNGKIAFADSWGRLHAVNPDGS